MQVEVLEDDGAGAAGPEWVGGPAPQPGGPGTLRRRATVAGVHLAGAAAAVAASWQVVGTATTRVADVAGADVRWHAYRRTADAWGRVRVDASAGTPFDVHGPRWGVLLVVLAAVLLLAAAAALLPAGPAPAGARRSARARPGWVRAGGVGAGAGLLVLAAAMVLVTGPGAASARPQLREQVDLGPAVWLTAAAGALGLAAGLAELRRRPG